ncbi:transposable element Tc3 transposase [Trichonephila clavipes]|nr:transposable element Tc3 transposase [Trichonephila clavipes]
MINGRTRLHVVANETMTGQRYIDEFLPPHVRLFRGAVGDKFVFMDDNATCYRTLADQDCLNCEGIQRLVWPARSPDLNPIENVWDALGRQNSRFRAAKTTIIKFGLHASFVELESAKNAVNEVSPGLPVFLKKSFKPEGGSTTRPLSLLIGRPPKSAYGPWPHSCGTHNHTFWPVGNVKSARPTSGHFVHQAAFVP